MTSPRRIELADPDYPAALRELQQPPPVLFLLGRAELVHRPGIAVVGTRGHSTYARDATVSLVVGLVRAGYVIISGLARGIDSIAHGTALDLGGDTVAVLGNGLDVAYPPEHTELAGRLAERGCLVSEFPPGTPPRKFHFPRRNRIIAGLARAVLVVEAPEKSGALITAQYALEDGKEVFAVPGPIHNPTSLGTNRLIQDGAGLVVSAADVLRALELRSAEPLPEALARGVDVEELAGRLGAEPEPSGSELARRVWDALGRGAADVDGLASSLGAGPGALASALLELELACLVRRLPGPRFARVAAPETVIASQTR